MLPFIDFGAYSERMRQQAKAIDEAQAKAQNCKLVEGGNVTVVQGTRVMAAPQERANGGGPAST